MDKSGDRIRKLRPGLWANIHAKRERGETPAKPGDKGYPPRIMRPDRGIKGRSSPSET